MTRSSRIGFCILAAVGLALGGCTPKAWPGVRSFYKDSQDEPAPKKTKKPAAAESGEAKKWWNPFGGGKKGDPSRSEPSSGASEPMSGDFAQGVRLVKSHQFAEAKTVFQSVSEQNPKSDEACRWLGDCHYNLMELQPAIDAYARATEINPNNYFALRGRGFALLYLGHDVWRAYEEACGRKEYEAAQGHLTQAHENYKLGLEVLQKCMQLYPGDDEASYGRAMAAEGASRLLYSNAVTLQKKSKKTEAEAWADNCMQIVDEGIKAAEVRIQKRPDENPPGPRALVGGLFLRRAVLLKEFGQTDQALVDLDKAITMHKAILAEVDRNNVKAQGQFKQCEELKAKWQSEGGAAPKSAE